MKTIKELRNTLDFHPKELASSIYYFARQKIDWDVFLPSIGKNLQRGFIWTIEQKRELINSILIGRHIPHCAIINTIDPADERSEILQIIDGKQRLSTMIDFYENKFSIEIDEIEYFINDLPEDYQIAIRHYYFRYYVVNEEDIKNPIADAQKINWFKFINFVGTPQDMEHLKNLTQI